MLGNCKIYTDGSTRNNGGQKAYGGYAYAVIVNDTLRIANSEGCINTTNQRMELTAALEGLKKVKEEDFSSITVYSDSAYLINCYQQSWWENWQKNGWLNSKKQPVANQDLWEQIIPFFKNKKINWEKVKGHATDKWNNYVDGLAQSASQRIKEKL